MADEILIDPRQLENLRRIGATLQKIGANLDVERLIGVVGDLQTLLDQVTTQRRAIEEFVGIREGEVDFLVETAAETISTSSAAAVRGLVLGSAVGGPGIGAIAAVVLGVLSAVIGAELDDLRREALSARQLAENRRFQFEQQLKATLGSLRSQEEILEEFQRSEAMKHRMGVGR